MLQLNATLKALIDKLWDRFWSGGISNPLSAIEQITYLLFMKQLDELDLKRQKDAEFTGDTYTSRFSAHTSCQIPRPSSTRPRSAGATSSR